MSRRKFDPEKDMWDGLFLLYFWVTAPMLMGLALYLLTEIF